MFANLAQVEILKDRAKKWEADGFPGADPRIPEVVTLINQLDGIAPVFSCEGHFDQADPHFYIMLAVDVSAFHTLKKLYDGLQKRLMLYHHMADANRACGLVGEIERIPSIAALQLKFVNCVFPVELPNMPAIIWYNAVVLEGDTMMPAVKEIFFKELLTTLQELVVVAKATKECE